MIYTCKIYYVHITTTTNYKIIQKIIWDKCTNEKLKRTDVGCVKSGNLWATLGMKICPFLLTFVYLVG